MRVVITGAAGFIGSHLSDTLLAQGHSVVTYYGDTSEVDRIEAVRKFYYTDVSAILVLIIATVMLIDYGTEGVRRRLIGRSADRRDPVFGITLYSLASADESGGLGRRIDKDG